MQKRRIEGLDLFRGLVAVAVVLYHFRDYLAIPWMSFAYIAVDLFFVLSGIVLAMKYTDSIASGMRFSRFASARLQRLYPMVFLAGVFIAGLNVSGVAPGSTFAATDHGAWRIFALWPLPASAGRDAAFPADSPMWSLWAELAVNALWFPVVRYGRRWMGFAGVVSVLGMLALTWHLQRLDYGMEAGAASRLMGLLRASAWFSVGCCIGRYEGKRVLPVWVSAAMFLGVIAAAVLTGHAGFRINLLIIIAGCVLLHSLFHAPVTWPPLSTPSRLLGMLSYPLYLIHGPAGRLLPQGGSMMEHWLAVIAILGGIAAIAAIANEWLVGRVHRLVRRRASLDLVANVQPTAE